MHIIVHSIQTPYHHLFQIFTERVPQQFLLFITSRDIVFSMSVYVSVVTKKWSVLEICLVMWTKTDKWLQVFWQAESERLF